MSATRKGEPVVSSTYTLIASSSSQRSTPAAPPVSQTRRNAPSRSSEVAAGAPARARSTSVTIWSKVARPPARPPRAKK